MMDNARTADQASAPDQPTKPVGYREAMPRSLSEKIAKSQERPPSATLVDRLSESPPRSQNGVSEPRGIGQRAGFRDPGLALG